MDTNPKVGVPDTSGKGDVVADQEPAAQVEVKEIPKSKSMKALPYIIGVLVILAGTGTGYLVSRVSARDSASPSTSSTGAVGGEDEAGIADVETFSDNAEGMLVEGGFEGEGTHHLERGAGDNKNVYLTSSVIDLDSFAGKKVKVWGQTVAAQAAPWLMDVGRVKVIE